MKKKIKWIVITAILIVLIGVYSIVDKSHSVYDTDVDSSDYVAIGIVKGEAIRQSFVSEEDILDGISIKMSVTGNLDSIDVKYTLEDQTGNLVALGESSLEDLKNGRFFKLSFDSVNECKGKEYSFKLSLTEADADTILNVFCVPGNRSEAEFDVEGEQMDGVMALRTITHRFDIETFIVTFCFLIYVVLFMKWLLKMFK